MVALPASTLPPDMGTFTLPVLTLTIDAADNLIWFQGEILFDSSVVTFPATPVQPAGLTANDWIVSGNVIGKNKLKTLQIVGYSISQTTPLQGSGTLFELKFNRARGGRPGAGTSLTWAPSGSFFFVDSQANARAPASTPPGRISIAGPSPTPSPTPSR